MNINGHKLEKCICVELDDFRKDVIEAFNYEVNVVCEYNGNIKFESDNEELLLWYGEVFPKLSKYYDVKITSIHMENRGLVYIWICYK